METFSKHHSLPYSSTLRTEKQMVKISFSTEKLTKSKCQVSLVVKYSLFRCGQTQNQLCLLFLYLVQMSGERLQDLWFSGLKK